MDEYISREAAIEALSAEALERNLDSVMTDDAHRYHRAAERAIAGVPAADVRPVRSGHWVKRMEEHTAAEYTSFTPIWSCSECGLEYDPAIAPRIHFCYNCGADMREAHDGNGMRPTHWMPLPEPPKEGT